MREIGRGQRIELLVIPEVQRLIEDAVGVAAGVRQRELVPRWSRGASVGGAGSGGAGGGRGLLPLDDPAQALRDVAAWLHLNSMRSEKIQFHLLCAQSLANVWRKEAYRTLLANHEQARVAARLPRRVAATYPP